MIPTHSNQMFMITEMVLRIIFEIAEIAANAGEKGNESARERKQFPKKSKIGDNGDNLMVMLLACEQRSLHMVCML